MNIQLIKDALFLADQYINDGTALPENSNDPYYVLSDYIYKAMDSINRPEESSCSTCEYENNNKPDGTNPCNYCYSQVIVYRQYKRKEVSNMKKEWIAVENLPTNYKDKVYVVTGHIWNKRENERHLVLAKFNGKRFHNYDAVNIFPYTTHYCEITVPDLPKEVI